MDIFAIMPAPSNDGRALAHFHLQLPCGVRLFNLRLVRNSSGQLRVYSPSARGSAAATFTPDAAQEIVALAVEKLEAAYDRHAA